MRVSYRIENLNQTYRMFDGAPEFMLKAVQKAMRAAGKVNKNALVASLGERSQWSDLALVKTRKTRRGDVKTTVGIVNRREVSGHQPKNGKDPIFSWYKCYWANYGTLENRDPSHQFKKPVKPQKWSAAKNRRNRIGQPHENFFERGSLGWQDRFFAKFVEVMDKESKRYFVQKGTLK